MQSTAYVLLILGATVATGGVVAYGTVGTIWLLGYPFARWRFPRRATMVAAIVLALVGLTRELPGLVRSVRAPVAAQESKQLASIFDAASRLELTKAEVDTAVRRLKLASWPQAERELILLTLSLKTERYMDLHQSNLLRTIVRTPIPQAADNPDFAIALAAADAKWTPLLQSAASGSEVVLAGEEGMSGVGLYYLSLMSAWGRWAVMTAIEEAYGLPTPLSATDREIGPILNWVNGYSAAFADDEVVVPISLATNDIVDAFDLATPMSNRVFDSLSYLSQVLGYAAQQVLEYQRQSAITAIDTGLAIATTILDGGPDIDWTQLNQRRRLIGLPVIAAGQGTNEAQLAAQFPWYLVPDADVISPSTIINLQASREEVSRRYEVMVGQL